MAARETPEPTAEDEAASRLLAAAVARLLWERFPDVEDDVEDAGDNEAAA